MNIPRVTETMAGRNEVRVEGLPKAMVIFCNTMTQVASKSLPRRVGTNTIPLGFEYCKVSQDTLTHTLIPPRETDRDCQGLLSWKEDH